MTTEPLAGAPVQLVIFDLMGTLITDDGIVDRAYDAALAQAGIPSSDGRYEEMRDRVNKLRGRPTLVVLTEVLDDPIRAEEATWAFDDSILDAVPSLAPVDGADEVLFYLESQHILSAVTTSFTPEVRRAVLQHCGWADTFAAALSPHGTRRGHPAPDLLLEAILALKIDSVAQVAIVGDSAPDLEAGNRAGAGLVIGALNGGAPAGRLEAAPHTHLIDSVAGLADVLERPRNQGARRTSDQ